MCHTTPPALAFVASNYAQSALRKYSCLMMPVMFQALSVLEVVAYLNDIVGNVMYFFLHFLAFRHLENYYWHLIHGQEDTKKELKLIEAKEGQVLIWK